MKYTLLATERSILQLYEAVAILMDIEPKKVQNYDCKKINVSSNIGDAIQNWYQSTYESKLGDDWKQKFGMEWVCYGPKSDENLPDNTIEVFDGFITT